MASDPLGRPAAEGGAPMRAVLARGLAVALDRRASCRVEPAAGIAIESRDTPLRVQAERLDALDAPGVLSPLARLLGVLGVVAGVRLAVQARVPAAAGLARDEALLVAAAGALLGHLGRASDGARVVPVARAAREAEAGAGRVHDLDLWTAVWGGVVVEAAAGAPPRRVACDPARLGQALLLVDAGLELRADPRAGTSTAEEHAVREHLAAALAARDDRAVPVLLERGLAATCAADPGFLAPAARPVLDVARALAGGARPCGAGGGGLLAAWIPPEARAAFQSRLGALGLRSYPCRVDLLGLEVDPG